MVRLDRIGLYHVLVIAQSIKQLRTVGLWIYRLEFDAVDKYLLPGAVGLGLHIQPARSLPDTGHAAQGTKIAQGMNIDVRWFGINVLGEFAHRALAFRR